MNCELAIAVLIDGTKRHYCNVFWYIVCTQRWQEPIVNNQAIMNGLK